jgi:outer membrane protein assembly factor BamB
MHSGDVMKQMLVWIELALAGAALAAEPATELAGFIRQAAGLDAGLAVVVNDSTGQLTAALAKGNRLYVQGCSWDAKGLPGARAALVAEGVAERASLVWSEADGIPYTDNIANLLVLPAWGSRPVDASELLRVLAPEGVALVGNDANPAAISGLDVKLKQAGAKDVKPLARKGWMQFSKPVDREFDTWTHNLGGPDLSYVNSDKAAGPWAEVRWVGTPRWGALYMSYSGRVSAGGRLYYIENRAGKAGTEVWLVGRDAWNGFEYWRQSIGAPAKYGNAGSSLACDDTRVFCVEENTTLVARDGRTGKKLREYAPGFMPRQVTSAESVLLTCNLNLNPPVATQVVALDKDSGKTLWTRPGIVHPPVENGTAFVLTKTELEGVDLVSGASRWKVKTESAAGYIRLFCKAGIVYAIYAPPYKPAELLVAHDAKTGALLWKKVQPDCGYGVMPYADELWLLKYGSASGGKGDNVSARVLDPHTGSVKRELTPKGTVGGHCYPLKGCADYLLYSSSWTLDRTPGTSLGQGTVRSPCNLGQMPANGMTYYLPHHCDCGVTLRGMLAMSRAGKKAWLPEGASEGATRLFPAGAAPAAAAAEKPEDWPIYRKDTARSNFTPAKLPDQLQLLWKEKLGASRLTQAVAAYGSVVVAEPESHRVCARDAATGRERWSFVADGRLDFPPALHKGLCLFGTAAGSVYALDAATGRELWRLRAAPAEKYIADEGQFASAWPVIGGVMPLNGEIFFTCGRAAKVDGGLWLLAVNAATGKVRWRVQGGSSADMFLSDNGKELLLTKNFYNVSNGGRAGRQDFKGLLHTTHYLTPVAIQDYMACVEPNLAHQKHVDLTDKRITGENLAFSDKLGVAAWRYRFGVPKELMKKEKTDQRFLYAKADGKQLWLIDENLRLQMTGVVLAGDTAYMAGIPTPPDPTQKAELWVLAGADGKKLQTLPLDSYPVYDGLSAANGRLYLATEDGVLTCFGAAGGK